MVSSKCYKRNISKNPGSTYSLMLSENRKWRGTVLMKLIKKPKEIFRLFI